MRNDQAIALELTIYDGAELVRRTTIVGDVIKIGRSERSDVFIDDSSIGRMHAVVEMQGPNAVTLIDLGNEPATRVNGVAVNKAPLKAGDEIGLGKMRLIVERIGHPVAPRIAHAQPLPRFDFGEHNPFMARRANPSPAMSEEGSYEYRLVRQEHAASPSNVETPAHGVALEIRWGHNILNVAHLSESEAYYLGNDESLPCDFALPAEKMAGMSRAPIVIEGAAVIWPGMRGLITEPSGETKPIEAVIAAGRTQPCGELTGAECLPLIEGMTVKLQLGDMTFELRSEKRGRKLTGWSMAALVGGAMGYVAASFVAHTGLLGALAMVAPPLGATGDDEMTDDQRYLVSQYLSDIAERERELEEAQGATPEQPTGERAGEGAVGEEGKAGSEAAPVRNARLAVKDNGGEPRLASREALMQDAADMGMIGLLNGMAGSVNAPIAAWGGLDASGPDDANFRGNMWGGEQGDAWGPGGLGLTGIGEGGGRKGHGIGLTNIGTFGGGFCEGCDGFGRGHGRLSKRHVATAPGVRMAPPAVSGRIPPEVIQRIVRMNYGRFRSCYETGLRTNPNLAGGVTVNFIINRDGQISSVGGGGSLPDSSVVSCITQAFYGLTFPQPEGGIVTVSYNLSLTPGS